MLNIRLTIVLGVALIGSSAAGVPAASAAQTIQVSASPSPTIDGVSTTVTVSGSSDTGGSVYASLDSSDAGCGSNPSNNSGNLVISGDSVGGPTYSDSGSTSPAAGSYVVCAWLMPAGDDGSGTPLAGPASAPLTVQPLQATVSLSAPVRVSHQQAIPVTINWRANAGGSLLVNILPSSYGPCTADPANEPQYVGWLTGQNGYTNNDAIGQDASTGTNRYLAEEFAPDTYRLCAWIEEASGTVVAGPVTVDVRMLALPGSRTYSGLTSQGLPVSVTITGYTIQDMVYSARFTCHAPDYFSTGLRWNGIWNDSVLTTANFGNLSVVNGRFGANLDRNPADQVRLRGTLAGNALTGSVQSLMRVGPPQFKRPDTCQTGRIRFTISTHSGRRRR
jgi:hypothetical protein